MSICVMLGHKGKELEKPFFTIYTIHPEDLQQGGFDAIFKKAG